MELFKKIKWDVFVDRIVEGNTVLV